ncbi:MAG: hypothetical protein FJY19_08045 [Bacteroidetes bacterium]|nr:hypothetical protein [Bacteroidota bacterium]
MGKYRAEDFHRDAVQALFSKEPTLAHLRVRRRADLLTIESGSADRPVPHARCRRVSVQYWRLEMATHMGRWEPTPFRGPLNDVVSMLVSDFGWVLDPTENPERTSETSY